MRWLLECTVFKFHIKIKSGKTRLFYGGGGEVAVYLRQYLKQFLNTIDIMMTRWGTINESTLIIEDFSALGQISLVSALTVLQAMNYTTAALPTAILSTQTEGFGTPKKLTTDQWMQQAINHWQLVPDLDFNGALIGYLGNTRLIPLIETLLTKKLGNRPVIVDPVMGDEGKLYPGLDQEYVKQIRHLCTHANIITPNWTELCLLTGKSTTLVATPDNAKKILNDLQRIGIEADVIITGVEVQKRAGCVFQSREEGFEFVGQPKVAGHFYGTGDVFAALLLGYLLKDQSLSNAVKRATALVYQAILETAADQEVANRKYGLKLGKLIQSIVSENQN